jgi:hypothetical protein
MATAAIFTAAICPTAPNAGGTSYLVQTAAALYVFYKDTADSDLYYKKSTDGGLTWGARVSVYVGNVLSFAVWYDKWSGLGTGNIHVVYSDPSVDDVLYKTVDTESADAQSGQTAVFAGTGIGTACYLSVTVSRAGNAYVAYNGSATEQGFAKFNGTSWDAKTTVFEGDATDLIILVPGFAADNDDIIAFFWDASANEISRKLYDQSGDSWAESSIAGSMTEIGAATSGPHWAAAVDLTDSVAVLAAWSGVDTANADLRIWEVNESAITEKTNVVLNGTDDQGMCAVCVDEGSNDSWTVYYLGKSDGSETWLSAVRLYKKQSTDRGTTWGAETEVSNFTMGARSLFSSPRFSDYPIPCVCNELTTGQVPVLAFVEASAGAGGGSNTYSRSRVVNA